MRVCELMASIHGDNLVERAANLVDNLNEWLNDTADISSVPTATMRYSSSYVAIEIGGVLVWDTEDAGEEMKFESCLKEWIEECKNNAAFAEKYDRRTER